MLSLLSLLNAFRFLFTSNFVFNPQNYEFVSTSSIPTLELALPQAFYVFRGPAHGSRRHSLKIFTPRLCKARTRPARKVACLRSVPCCVWHSVIYTQILDQSTGLSSSPGDTGGAFSWILSLRLIPQNYFPPCSEHFAKSVLLVPSSPFPASPVRTPRLFRTSGV